MLKVSYNANGLRSIPVGEAVREVSDAGYDGIELSLHPTHLNPFTAPEGEIADLASRLSDAGLPVACLATGADILLSEVPFEPSLIHPDPAGRRRRVDLIRRAIDLARRVNAPVVNFASGVLRDGLTPTAAWGHLVDGIHQCLEYCGTDVTLALEPEVGFLVEGNCQALTLLTMVGDPRLGVNQDIGHENVYQPHYLEAIRVALPQTRHMHVEDIKARYHRHEIPGEGDVDFRGLLRTLLADGYQHFISVELYNHAHVYRGALRQSLAYLRAVEEAVAAGAEVAQPC